MPETSASSAAPVQGSDASGLLGHPRGLTPLFLTEMWERFSYYGMRALLTLFMVAPAAVGGLGYDERTAATVYGNYTMSVYLLGIVGGYLADNFVGARRAVLVGGIVIASGHFAMAFPSEGTFFTGLALIAAGTGLLKPNISTMVGQLYSDRDARRDAGFSLFYMGINLGAFLSPYVTGWLAQSASFRLWLSEAGMDPRSSWHWGFAAAGVGMTLGVIVYLMEGARIRAVGVPPAPGQPRPWAKLAGVIAGSLAVIGILMLADASAWQNVQHVARRFGAVGVADWIQTHPNLHRSVILFLLVAQIGAVAFFALRRTEESKRIAAILVFLLASEAFWAIFEQAGSSVALFANDLTDNRVLGRSFPSSWYQSINSLWVILLAPCFSLLWVRLGRFQPSSAMKFVLGLALLGLSYALMVPASHLAAGSKVSPLWIVGLFLLQTMGELCLSPVGLSTMSRLAPARLAGLMMGLWFLSLALGNKFAGVLAGDFNSANPAGLGRFFGNQALLVGACALVLLLLVPWIRRLTGEAAGHP